MPKHIDFIPVLLGGDANAYGMARSFFEQYGVVSHAIGKGAFHICRHSKFMTCDISEANIEDDDVFVNTLINFAKQFAGQTLVLVPCGDNYTKLLVRNQDALRDAYSFSIMTPEQFDLLSTKDRFYETCTKFGLEFPMTWEVTKNTFTSFKAPDLYPLIVKPANSVAYWNCSFPGKKKVFEVRNEEELHAVFDAVYASSYDDTLIVQDFIPGDDTAMRVMNCYSDRNGKVKMMCLGDVLLEEHTPEGIGSYGAIMTGFDSEINERIKGFLEEIGYIGFSNFDMKYDCRDGSYKLFEINPRQGRSSYFCTASGMNLARFIVEDAVYKLDTACEVATLDSEVLWTMVPLSIIRQYVKEPRAKKRAKQLIKQGKVRQSYWTEEDKSVLRWVSFKANQHNYRKQYAQCFGHRHIDD